MAPRITMLPAAARRDSEAVSIRRCAPGDETALAMLGQATFLEAFAGVVPGDNLLAHCVRQHSREKYATWLADAAIQVWLAVIEPGQAPVGYLVLTTPDLPLPDIGPRDAEVKRVYVLHRFQGRRIGIRLMNEALAYSRASGITRLLLGVYSKNTSAIGFYERLGYRKIGRRNFRVGDGVYEDFVLALPVGA